jgi:hypothetical protein
VRVHKAGDEVAILAFDAQGNFVENLGSGQTLVPVDATVPEPGTILLLGSGLAAVRATRKKLRAPRR